MYTEVVIHSMKAYVWCLSKICDSLDEIPSVTMGSCKTIILNDFCGKLVNPKVTMFVLDFVKWNL